MTNRRHVITSLENKCKKFQSHLVAIWEHTKKTLKFQEMVTLGLSFRVNLD